MRSNGVVSFAQGAVHKVRHAIFGQFYPLPLSHIRGPPKVRHTSRTPRFLVGLVQNTRTKAPCTNSLLFVRARGILSGGFVRRSFVWKVLSGMVFVRSPFCSNTSVTTES